MEANTTFPVQTIIIGNCPAVMVITHSDAAAHCVFLFLFYFIFHFCHICAKLFSFSNVIVSYRALTMLGLNFGDEIKSV